MRARNCKIDQRLNELTALPLIFAVFLTNPAPRAKIRFAALLHRRTPAPRRAAPVAASAAISDITAAAAIAGEAAIAIRSAHDAETNEDAQRIREKNSKPTESFGGSQTSRAYEQRSSQMKRTLVRYKIKPEQVADNARLIERVFEELKAKTPDNARYMVLQLNDGTFVHFAMVENMNGNHPITSLEAFRTFQSGIKERCIELPQSGDATIVGNYRMVDE
jgi:hypothetical protein